MARSLPAAPFAHEVLALLASSEIELGTFARSVGVTPDWLARVLAGDITELPLRTVASLCRHLRIMPEDLWDPAEVAHAFARWPAARFAAEAPER